MAAELQDHEHGDLRWKVIATNNSFNSPERIALVDADVFAGLVERAEQAEASNARARAVHPSREEADVAETLLCPECIAPVPCATRRALDGEAHDA